jgi:hypothetical protein
MTKLRLIGTAMVLSSVLAGSAMAQQMSPTGDQQRVARSDQQRVARSDQPRMAQRNVSTVRKSTTVRESNAVRPSNAAWNNGWHDSRNDGRWDRRDTGFWPGEVAAGVVGGAIGTAGAIATAPFRGDAYARYDNGYRGGRVASNGFVCQPGTWFKGEDGRRHICQ